MDSHAQVAFANTTPTPPRRRRWLLPAIAAVILLAAGAAAYVLWPRDITVTGSLSLVSGRGVDTSGSSCRGTDGYDDLREGAQVVVTDPAGVTLAVTQLGVGESKDSTTCTFPFTVKVRAGRGIYGIEVSHRKMVYYTEAELAGPVQLSIGGR